MEENFFTCWSRIVMSLNRADLGMLEFRNGVWDVGGKDFSMIGNMFVAWVGVLILR